MYSAISMENDSMPNSWFRLYSEFSHDPKVQMMSEAMQRRLVMIFCMRCSETLQERSIAFHLRISEEELQETKKIFIANGFIDEDWNLLNWRKRQFISDSSTDRVRKFRGKVSDETFPKRSETVTVTTPDTDTDTESDTELKHTSIHEDSDRTAVRRVFGFYLQKTRRNISTYKLTDLRMKKGLKCLRECRSRFGEDGAEAAMMQAVEGLAGNAFLMGHNDSGKAYTDWENHVFKSVETMEKRWGDYEKCSARTR